MQFENLAANKAWFDFKMDREIPGFDGFSVYSISGTETVCAPFEYTIEVVCRNSNLDLTEFLGKTALLTIADRSGAKKLTHGVIRKMDQLHTGNTFTHYRCELAPRFFFLGLTKGSKIYQHKSVKEVIEIILRKHVFPAETYAFKLRETYPEREYCVQYRESDREFAERLIQEEGWYYYWEHTEKGHCLCFSDAPGGPPIPGENALRFHPGSGQPADTAVISRVSLHHRINSDMATYREWNFTTPGADLECSKKESDGRKAPVPHFMELETYEFPHLYQEGSEGERYAKIQLLRQLTFRQWMECESDVARFLPGFTFTMHDHPRDDANRGWWVVSVHHEGKQPGVLEHEAPDNRGLEYKSEVTAIPDDTRYVPEQTRKKVRIDGLQSAIVVGPAGEEVYCDKYARVLVLFPWDRSGKHGEKTSCWVRVSQGWAGSAYGTMAIPRIGQEVLIEFMEGNVDRPVITGRVYNAANMPPYDLPQNKTRTVFASMSTPGKEGEPRGFNELRIEDKKGEEEIYVHAEKDVNIHIKHDLRELVENDSHATIKNNSYLVTEAETNETFKGVKKIEHFATSHRTLHGDDHLKVDGKWLAKADEEIHFRSGMKIVIDCGSELTLKAAGSFIKLDASGITLVGPVSMNSSGSPGIGSGANPETPNASEIPVQIPVRYSSRQLAMMEKAAENHDMFCPICEGGEA